MRLSRTLMFIVLLTLLLNAVYSFGAEFCVDNAPDLKAALSTAQSNGESDVIRVVQGNYNENFSYYSSQGYSITLPLSPSLGERAG